MIKIYTGLDSPYKRKQLVEWMGSDDVVLTPEQHGYEMENLLIQKNGETGFLGTRVLNFSRLMKQAMAEYSTDRIPLHNSAKHILLRYILKENQKNLQVFLPSIDQEGFIEEMIRTLDFLRSEKISDEELEKMLADEEDVSILQKKIQDLRLIYQMYNQRMSEDYVQEQEVLEWFSQTGCKYLIREQNIWIVHFNTFSKDQLTMIRALHDQTKVLHVSINMEDSPQTLAFRMIQQLREISDELEVIRVSNNLSTSYVDFAKELIEPENCLLKKKAKVDILKANTMYDEVEYVGADILLKKSRDPQLLAKDFQVILSDPAYLDIFVEVFNRFEIPIYADRRMKLIRTKPVSIVFSLLKWMEYPEDGHRLLSFFKTYLQENRWDALDELESQMKEGGAELEDYLQGKRENELIEEYKEILLDQKVQKIASPKQHKEFLLKLLEDLKIKEYLEDEIRELVEKKETQEAQILEQIWSTFVEVFNQLVLTLEEKPISLNEFRRDVEVAMKEYEISTTPQDPSAISVSLVTRSIPTSVKHLYVVGFNDEKYPLEYRDDRLFGEEEIEKLEEFNFEVYNTAFIKEEVFKDRFLNWLSFTTESLMFTMSATSLGGEAMDESSYYPRVLELADVHERSGRISQDYLLDRYYLVKDLYERFVLENLYLKKVNQFYKAFDYMNYEELLKKEESYSKVTSHKERAPGSVSRFECFVQCPFKHFVRYELAPIEQKEYDIDGQRKGNLYHAIMERVLKLLQKDSQLDIEQSVEREMRNLLETEEYAMFRKNHKNQWLSREMKKELIAILAMTKTQLQRSDFKPVAFEQKIYDVQKSYSFRGVIDRIDESNDHFVIYDYKTYAKTLSLDGIYHGLDLQLALYADIQARRSGKKPAGFFYHQLYFPLNREEKGTIKSSIAQQSLTGYFIGDETLALELDHELGTEDSLIPLSLKKDGRFNASRKNFLSDHQAELLIQRAKYEASEIAKRIEQGENSIFPMQKNKTSACVRCDYQGICRFVPGRFTWGYREVPSFNDAEILEKLERNE